jgi:hypothetical protein
LHPLLADFLGAPEPRLGLAYLTHLNHHIAQLDKAEATMVNLTIKTREILATLSMGSIV